VHELDRGGELDVAIAASGIIVTSEPVRERIAPLTRCMSAETRSTRRSIEGSPGLPNGRTTAT
jgi:hypothetical protein